MTQPIVEKNNNPPHAGPTTQKARRVYFVVNDRAGQSNRAELDECVQKHVADDVEFDIFVRTDKKQDRREITRKAVEEGYDTIVAVGGDGTVSQVADSLVGTDVTLGIVPTGTANLVARHLGVPLDVDEALKLIMTGGALRRLDGMRADHTYFSHVSLGVYSLITKRESKKAKKLFGRAVYSWHLLGEVIRHRSWEFRLTLDDRERTVRATMVLAANIGATGVGDMQWGENIRADDGCIDVCIVQARGVTQYTRLIYDALRGHPARSPFIEYERVRQRLVISTTDELPLRADGKKRGHGRIDLEVVPGAVSVIVPGDASNSDKGD